MPKERKERERERERERKKRKREREREREKETEKKREREKKKREREIEREREREIEKELRKRDPFRYLSITTQLVRNHIAVASLDSNDKPPKEIFKGRPSTLAQIVSLPLCDGCQGIYSILCAHTACLKHQYNEGKERF